MELGQKLGDISVSTGVILGGLGRSDEDKIKRFGFLADPNGPFREHVVDMARHLKAKPVGRRPNVTSFRETLGQTFDECEFGRGGLTLRGGLTNASAPRQPAWVWLVEFEKSLPEKERYLQLWAQRIGYRPARLADLLQMALDYKLRRQEDGLDWYDFCLVASACLEGLPEGHKQEEACVVIDHNGEMDLCSPDSEVALRCSRRIHLFVRD